MTVRVRALDRPIPDGMAITTIVCALALAAQLLRGLGRILDPRKH